MVLSMMRLEKPGVSGIGGGRGGGCGGEAKEEARCRHTREADMQLSDGWWLVH